MIWLHNTCMIQYHVASRSIKLSRESYDYTSNSFFAHFHSRSSSQILRLQMIPDKWDSSAFYFILVHLNEAILEQSKLFQHVIYFNPLTFNFRRNLKKARKMLAKCLQMLRRSLAERLQNAGRTLAERMQKACRTLAE